MVASLAPAGENSYSWLLAEGGELNSSTCSYPWDHVMAGLPPFLPQDQIDPVTGNRYALMNSIDKHRPRRCLADDDLEALNTLYPTCAGAVTVVTCPRQPLIFLGWFRICFFLLVPLAMAVFISLGLQLTHIVVTWWEEREKRKLREEREKREKREREEREREEGGVNHPGKTLLIHRILRRVARVAPPVRSSPPQPNGGAHDGGGEVPSDGVVLSVAGAPSDAAEEAGSSDDTSRDLAAGVVPTCENAPSS